MPAFHIEQIHPDGTRQLLRHGDGSSILYHSVENAQDFITYTKALRPESKYRLIKILDESKVWIEREEARFTSGYYNPVPWPTKDAFKHHFVHLSRDKDGMIAYTPNADYGQADRQIRVRPGKYLTEFYPEFGPDTIRDYCAQVSSNSYVMKITQDADEIERVYAEGPSSCMAHPSDFFAGNIHPARAYAGPDLAVAYLIHPDGDIVARAVVFPARREHTRIYGDGSRLGNLLSDDGYTRNDGDWSGARLTRIESPRGIVAPYIDFSPCRADDDSTHLVMSRSGTFYLQDTCGIINLGTACACCSVYLHEDDLYYIGGSDEQVCEECYRNNYFRCDFCDERFHIVNVNTVAGDNHVCNYCLPQYYFHCVVCDEYHKNTEDEGSHESLEGDVCSLCVKDMHYDEDASVWRVEPPAEDSESIAAE